MKEKKIGYSVHLKGELEKTVECPMGIYFVDLEHQLYWFQPAKDFPHPEDAESIATVIAAVCDAKGIKMGRIVGKIIKNFVRLDDKDVKTTDNPEKIVYDFYIQGDLEAYVTEPTLGTLYGDMSREVFFFDPKHKGFMGPILQKKFREGIAEDLKSKDLEKKSAAVAVLEIFDNWVELDEDDIVK